MAIAIYTGGIHGYNAVSEILEGTAEVVHVEADPMILTEQLKNADAFLDASMKVRITREMFEGSPNLKIISCATTGSDHIDKNSAEKHNVEIRTLREDAELLMNITPAAELSWALLMACARKLNSAFKHVTEGKWSREEFPGVMLKGKRLGLIGCGRIGGWMARYAQAFGMDVIGYDPFLKSFPSTIKPATLEDLFDTSDFISVHVHLSDETSGLVSENLLNRCRKGVIIINTSRGQIIDEVALLSGLLSGHIGAAGLDVLTGEPEINNHPLVDYARVNENLLITPHCGGYSPDSLSMVCARAAEKIKYKLSYRSLE
jgi:phosphoglycerate dehydrogenase-like enzyme